MDAADVPVVFYDTAEFTEEVKQALRDSVLKIEVDCDRVGWSKTGIIYRFIWKAEAYQEYLVRHRLEHTP